MEIYFKFTLLRYGLLLLPYILSKVYYSNLCIEKTNVLFFGTGQSTEYSPKAVSGKSSKDLCKT